jgi:F0F1-type ATP synthase membrane subunit b/b'
MLIALIVNFLAFDEAGKTLPAWFPWWLNYPGFEAWKFVNFFVFVAALFFVLRRFGVADLMRERRDNIRRELMRAQEERNAAQAKLQEVEARLANLDAEVASVREQSMREINEERERIARSTEEDARKLREQAQREIESAGKAARAELRQFAAEQSVRLAEEMIWRDMRPEDDARLIALHVQELGGQKH